MDRFNDFLKMAIMLGFLTIASAGQASRLFETDGIELSGTARIVANGAGTCHVLEARHSAEDYERIKGNDGKALDVWQLNFSVHNGSGKPLDHLIARFGIASPWPPCTNWSGPTGEYPGPVDWANVNGHIQRSGKPYAVAAGETLRQTKYILAFHEDEPRFADWSVDFNFAETSQRDASRASSPAQANRSASQPEGAPAATQPRQAPGLPAGIASGTTCGTKSKVAKCWMELANQPGCFAWLEYGRIRETMTWTGRCSEGLAQGAGTMTQTFDEGTTITGSGRVQGGKRHGDWLLRGSDGAEAGGPYLNGERHGAWVERSPDGSVSESYPVHGDDSGEWLRVGLERARAVLKTGVDPNASAFDGDLTYMQLAINTKTPQIVDLLLEFGADPNLRSGGETPVCLAAEQGLVAVVTILLKAGADPNRTCIDAGTPLHRAASGEVARTLVARRSMGAPNASMYCLPPALT